MIFAIKMVCKMQKKADIALLEKSLFDVGDWGIK